MPDNAGYIFRSSTSARNAPAKNRMEDPAYERSTDLPALIEADCPRSYERSLYRSVLFPSQAQGVLRSTDAVLDDIGPGFEWLGELVDKNYDDLEVRKVYGSRAGEYTKQLAHSPAARQYIFESLDSYQYIPTRSFLLGMWFDASVKPEAGFWGGAGPSPDAYIHLSRQVATLHHTSHAALPAFHIARGGLAYLAGNKSEAVLHYRAAADASSSGVARLDQLSLGAYTAGSMEDFFLAQGEFTFPGWLDDVNWKQDPVEGDVLMLVGCDEVYFAAFAHDLVASAAEHDMSADLHFHIYNPTGFTDKHFAALQTAFPNINLSYSTESFHIRDIRAAYTCIRYWRMPQFLDRWGRPILLVDADCSFKGDLAGHIDRGAHLGFRRFPQYPGVHPWRNMSANTFYARPTLEG